MKSLTLFSTNNIISGRKTKNAPEIMETMDHLQEALRDFLCYRQNTVEAVLKTREELAKKLRDSDAALATILEKRVIRANSTIANQKRLTDSILAVAEDDLCNARVPFVSVRSTTVRQPSPSEREESSAKVQVTLRQFWRDWTIEAYKERENAYEPLVDALEAEYATMDQNTRQNDQETNVKPDLLHLAQGHSESSSINSPMDSVDSLGSTNQEDFLSPTGEYYSDDHTSDDNQDGIVPYRVLVPGAGLCRLAFDLHDCGNKFEVEANELSHHHLLAVNWIWRAHRARLKLVLHPWALQFSNQISLKRQFEDYLVPFGPLSTETHQLEFKTDPFTGLSLSSVNSTENPTPKLSVTTHDFHLYSSPRYAETFNAVATAFFVDTAPNIREYVSIINHVLPIGGLWVNNGPLLWNCWENGPPARGEGDPEDDEAARARHGLPAKGKNEPFTGKVELTWEELLMYLEMMGFKVEEQDTSRTSGYVLDEESMLQSIYRLGFFKARKVANIPANVPSQNEG
jgi:N2227-like protein